MNIADLIAEYWGIIAVILGGGVYFFTHKKTAIAFAKSKIKTLIFAAEKGAESLVLENGAAKMEWVVEKGYAILPPIIKAFVSKAVFRILVQSLFDEAKEFIEKNKEKEKQEQ